MGQAAPKKRENTIGNFYPDMVDGKVIRAFLKEQKIKLDAPEDSDDEPLALALTLYFRGKTDEDHMCQCERCHGEAPDSYDACPFCGMVGATADPPELEPVDDEDDAIGARDEEPAPEAEEEEEAAEAPVASKKKPKGSSKPTPKKKKEDAKMGSKALAKVGATGMVSEKDLDASVDRILKLKVQGAKVYWDLCNEVLDNNKRGLWKQRLDAKGNAKYASFDAFCSHEIHMSSTNAFNMMAVAREWTPDDIEQMGRSKAVLVLKAAPEDRKALAEAAKKGEVTDRQLRDKVKQSRKKRGHTGDSPQARGGSKGGAAKAAKIAKDKITIAKIEGMKVVKLYERPVTMRNLDLEACKRVNPPNKTVTEWLAKVVPFGRIELDNSVCMYITIKMAKDGLLVAKIDTRRESPIE